MGNSQTSLTSEEERVNEKIVAIQNHERVQRMKKQLYDKFVHDYSNLFPMKSMKVRLSCNRHF